MARLNFPYDGEGAVDPPRTPSVDATATLTSAARLPMGKSADATAFDAGGKVWASLRVRARAGRFVTLQSLLVTRVSRLQSHALMCHFTRRFR
jgi:hypothetical protein